jgi:branched-chain amino acid transport system ATP-binding protein
LLAVENLHVRYGKVTAVRGVSLECQPGEIVALLGPNGAGKSSTLLAIAGGLDRAAVQGTVSLENVELHGLPAEEVNRRGLVLVPERRRIFASLTVRENLLVGASGWASRRQAEAEALTVFERLPFLAPLRGRHGGLLSGGQQQLLAIGRGLMARPKALLLDEPSIGLAPDGIRTVFAAIRELRAQGIAILLVEQNVRQALEMADHAFLLRKGQLEGRAGQDRDLVLSSYLGRRADAEADAEAQAER